MHNLLTKLSLFKIWIREVKFKMKKIDHKLQTQGFI